MKNLLTVLILAIAFFSCNEVKKGETKDKTATKTEEIAANYKNIEVEIEGMTCEIGCAKLIESKVHKLEGVTFSKVSFEEKTGQFSFDSNKISK